MLFHKKLIADLTAKQEHLTHTLAATAEMLSSRNADHSQEPTLENPVSQLVTKAQLDSDIYKYWCEKIHETPRYHRKQWEYVYVLQALQQLNKLREGSRGLGFGVGTEPLPALMASMGCTVVATDMAPELASDIGWTQSNEYAGGLEKLNNRGICDPEIFQQRVTFQVADMKNLSTSFRDFDYVWSSCALEHLGSIELGLKFIEDSLLCLQSGGVAVHTTEYNLSSNDETIDHEGTVLFRKKDIEGLIAKLTAQGHHITMNFNEGGHVLDYYIDIPPYTADTHLKLLLQKYITTSLGLIVTKG